MKWICLIALCSSGATSAQAASKAGDTESPEILNHIHAVNSLDKPSPSTATYSNLPAKRECRILQPQP